MKSQLIIDTYKHIIHNQDDMNVKQEMKTVAVDELVVFVGWTDDFQTHPRGSPFQFFTYERPSLWIMNVAEAMCITLHALHLIGEETCWCMKVVCILGLTTLSTVQYMLYLT